MICTVLGFLYINISFCHGSGRLLFTVIGPSALLLSLGLEYSLLLLARPRLASLWLYIVGIGCVATDVISIIQIHQFYYRLEQYLP